MNSPAGTYSRVTPSFPVIVDSVAIRASVGPGLLGLGLLNIITAKTKTIPPTTRPRLPNNLLGSETLGGFIVWVVRLLRGASVYVPVFDLVEFVPSCI